MTGGPGSHAARRRPRRTRAVVSGVVLAALVIAAVVWAQRDGDDGAPDEPSAKAAAALHLATPEVAAPGLVTPGVVTSEPSAASPHAVLPYAEQLSRATEIAAGLSLEELAGQLIVARNTSDEASLALVRDKHFAGVLVTSPRIREVTTDEPLADVVAYNERLHAIGRERGVPVMVPIDQEGGLVTRLRAPLTQFPTAMTYGAAMAGRSADAAQAVADAGRAAGAELRAVGYNTVFAPDGDITSGADEPNIGSRSPGSDPATTARAVVALVGGYRDAGIVATVKHFPGNGTLRKDSHVGLPMQHTPLAALRTLDYVPFQAAVDAGVTGIMTGHVELPELDAKVPGSMSRAVVTGELRERLGYDGLVVSDSLGMGAVIKRYPHGRAAVQAIVAGNDIALMPEDNDEAYAAMLAALRSGELPEEQARASAARTIAALLWADASAAPRAEPGSNEAVSERLSAAAVTIVEGSCSPRLDAVRPRGNAEAVAAFRAAAASAGLRLGSGRSIAFVGYGGAPAAADIVVATDTPYVLGASDAPTKIALYGRTPAAMRALVAVLTGTAPAPGALPVTVDDVERKGCH